jgi:pyridoxine 5'-phosphate synthase PdxJ
MAFVPEPDRRREVFNLQSLAGGEVYGEALLRKEIGDSVLAQKRDLETSKLSRLFPEATFPELQEAQGRLEYVKRIADIAKRLGISVAAAEELEHTVGETGLRTTEARLRGGDAQAAEALAPGHNELIGQRRTAEELPRREAARLAEDRARYYAGMPTHPTVVRNALETSQVLSRVRAGHSPYARALEQAAADAILEQRRLRETIQQHPRSYMPPRRPSAAAGTSMAEVFRRAVEDEPAFSSSSTIPRRGGASAAAAASAAGGRYREDE